MRQAGFSPTGYARSTDLQYLHPRLFRILDSVRPVNFPIGSLTAMELLARADHQIAR
jgi:hypothetical protein